MAASNKTVLALDKMHLRAPDVCSLLRLATLVTQRCNVVMTNCPCDQPVHRFQARTHHHLDTYWTTLNEVLQDKTHHWISAMISYSVAAMLKTELNQEGIKHHWCVLFGSEAVWIFPIPPYLMLRLCPFYTSRQTILHTFTETMG